MNVQLKFFGAFRKYFDVEELELSEQVTVRDFRRQVRTDFLLRNASFDVILLEDSVFATEEKVLSESDFIKPGAQIAILPPVCGG